MQFCLDYCCCRSSEFFSTSISFDISETFPCRWFIVFSFSFLSVSYWSVFLVINSTGSLKSFSYNSPLICELWVFSCISFISLTLFSTFSKQLNSIWRRSGESILVAKALSTSGFSSKLPSLGVFFVLHCPIDHYGLSSLKLVKIM